MVEKNTKSAGKKWLKLSLQTPARLVESVSDMLGVLSGSGVEISPETESGSLISGFFPVESGADEAETVGSVRRVVGELFQLFALPIPEIKTEIIDDQDWATSWKRFFTPVEIVPGLIIKPSWEDYRPQGNEKVIEMDPGQAFGTGQHESTQMALSLLTSCLSRNQVGRVLDVGTGTGILAMAAALFGANSVVAVDNDPEAVRVAGENVTCNGLAGKVTVSGTALADVQGPFSCILANIVHDVLVEMAPQLKALLSPGGRVILAGILSGEQEENIIQTYAELGLQQQAGEHDGEWAALLLQMS